MAAASKIGRTRSHTGDRQIDAVQAAAQRSADVANGCPFLRGVLRSVAFAGGTQKAVDHGLGVPAACIVVRQNYNVFSMTASLAEALPAFQATLDVNTQLGLVTDLDCTLDLWFYPRASEAVAR